MNVRGYCGSSFSKAMNPNGMPPHPAAASRRWLRPPDFLRNGLRLCRAN
jgi:hypothetical protein